MMVFRPQGMISMARRIYRFEGVKEGRGIDK
jgi:hypothetical protein